MKIANKLSPATKMVLIVLYTFVLFAASIFIINLSNFETSKENKGTVFHSCQTCGDGDHLPDSGDQTADEGGNFAMFPEDFFRSLQGFRFQEEIFSIFIKEGPPEFFCEEIIDISSGETTGGTDQDREQRIQPPDPGGHFSAQCKKTCGDHNDFAWKRNEGTFNGHKEKDQQESPCRSIGGS